MRGTAGVTPFVPRWPKTFSSTPRAWATTCPHQGGWWMHLCLDVWMSVTKCWKMVNMTKIRMMTIMIDYRAWGFPGLRPGDRWCLCSRRWRWTPPIFFSLVDSWFLVEEYFIRSSADVISVLPAWSLCSTELPSIGLCKQYHTIVLP